MKGLHPLAAAALAAFALCTTIALAADLGHRDAAAEFAADSMPVLQVYASGSAGAPVLDEKNPSAFRSINGVRAAIAITEQQAMLSGLDYALPVTIYAADERSLPELSLPLQQGALPGSAWRPQALAGSALAIKLANAAHRIGLSLPGTVRLTVEGGGSLDVQISGAAAAAGNARDHGLWLDASILRSLLPEARPDSPLPITRVEVEARSVLAANEVEQVLRTKGYLVENPTLAPARTLEESAAMRRQWGILAALALACAAVALWRRRPARLIPAAVSALCAAAVGVALAAVLMQTATLLDMQFFLSTDARYLLNAPRLLAVGLLTAALALGSTAATWTKAR